MVLSRNKKQPAVEVVYFVLQTEYYTLYPEEPYINCSVKFIFPQTKQSSRKIREKGTNQSFTYPNDKWKIWKFPEKIKPP